MSRQRGKKAEQTTKLKIEEEASIEAAIDPVADLGTEIEAKVRKRVNQGPAFVAQTA